MLTLHVKTDQVIKVGPITNREGTVQTNATVAVTVTNARGDAVEGTWPQSATHTSDGVYELQVDDDWPLVLKRRAGLKARTTVTLIGGATQRKLEDDIEVVVGS